MIWFVIWAVLLVLNIGINLAKHGEPKNERYNFWGTTFSVALSFVLIYLWGGFNTLFGW